MPIKAATSTNEADKKQAEHWNSISQQDLSTWSEGLRFRSRQVFLQGFVGMVRGLHLFTAMNWAWSPAVGAGSVLLRREVVANLHPWPEGDGFEWGRSRECGRRGGGMRNRGRWFSAPSESQFSGGSVAPLGRQVLRFVSAPMARSCTDGPSCIFVGPIETAEKVHLEALYQQARDSYYSGQPLVVDDMFDKVEMQLRWLGSKLVLKYPRCSLKRFTAYADAEADPSQMRVLKIIWGLLFAVGLGVAVGLPSLVSTYMEFNSHEPGTFIVWETNWMFLSVVGFLVGALVAQGAVKQLQALERGDLIALKGRCPNCGEEVYTFVKADHPSLKARHESECHICERQLVFQATLCPSKSGQGQPLAHGRVYLQAKTNQLS